MKNANNYDGYFLVFIYFRNNKLKKELFVSKKETPLLLPKILPKTSRFKDINFNSVEMTNFKKAFSD